MSTTQVATSIKIPSIMTDSTYYWHPSQSASGRRYNEKKRTNEVASFLMALGFEIITHDNTNVTAKLEEVEVFFTYAESTTNVYKSLHITNRGLKSNISLIRKMLV